MKINRTQWWGTLTLLLLVAFALRVWALEAVPPGLTHDEAANGHDSAAILRGVHRIYFPVGYGREPLYNYSVAAVTALLGQGIFTLRFTTVLWSLLTWMTTVALARRWWGREVALATGAALAIGFWPLMMARVGLRAPALPALLAASALAYDHALAAPTARRAQSARRTWRGYLLSGLFLGASLYTYMASRGMPALYVTFLLALAIFNRATLRTSWKGTLALLATAAAVSAPLFLTLRANPELELRIAQLGSALTALRSGDWHPLWQNVTASLPMLLWKADPRWLYNVGGRAALEPLWAALFLTGVLHAVTHLRDRRNLFVLLWLCGGLAPAMLTSVEYNTLHAIAALPAAFLLTGYGFASILRYTSQIAHRTSHIANYALRMTHYVLFLAFLLTAVESAHAYFVTWARHRDVRVNYHQHVVALGRYLDAAPDDSPVVITSLYPGEFHDPYSLEVTLRRDDLLTRWADGRSALFFPHGETRLYTETQSAPAPALRVLIDDHATPDVVLTFAADDIPNAIYGARWDADAAWAALQADLDRADGKHPTVYIAAGDPPPGTPHTAMPCPVTFDDAVALTGYAITSGPARPGATVELLTAWEVVAPHPAELVLFTHLARADGSVIAQVDRLDAPSWQWQTGDRFAHIHTLPLPQEIPPGDYYLVVGFYGRASATRLLVDVAPGPVTRVVIPLEVRAP